MKGTQGGDWETERHERDDRSTSLSWYNVGTFLGHTHRFSEAKAAAVFLPSPKKHWMQSAFGLFQNQDSSKGWCQISVCNRTAQQSKNAVCNHSQELQRRICIVQFSTHTPWLKISFNMFKHNQTWHQHLSCQRCSCRQLKSFLARLCLLRITRIVRAADIRCV